MIDRVAGWSWALRDSGIVLTSEVGRIRYQEQLRPLRRVRAIAASLPVPPGWHDGADAAIERLTTREHEHAALISIDGRNGDQPARRVVGVVLLDESYALVDGVAVGAPHLDGLARTVRELTLGDTHMLGERRRRFVYRPPTWPGLLVRPHHAYWLSPGYPGDGTYLLVFPAQPRSAFRGEARDLVASLNQLKGWDQAPPALLGQPISLANGMSGQLFQTEVRNAPVVASRIVAVLEGQRYLYPMLLEAPTARLPEVLPLFKELVESVEPLAGEGRAPVVEHWVE